MATKTQINNFIKKLGELARSEVAKRKATGKSWSLASVCIAQSALETGWGTSDLMIKANAFFGIKAGKSWRGKVYSSKTSECYDGVNFTSITALFRAYDSLEDSVKDYFDLICNNKRYSGAVAKTDAEACITAIKEGGYAMDPDYIAKIMDIVNKYDLTRYDDVTPAKSIDEVAREVIAGKWGNGSEREIALTKAGYNYDKIQDRVNAIIKSNESDFIEYQIKRGDTLWKIAKQFYNNGSKANIDKIARYNNIPNPDVIIAGKVIKIPR